MVRMKYPPFEGYGSVPATLSGQLCSLDYGVAPRRTPLSWPTLTPENNRDSPPGTIDLHGLYVKEAIERTEAAIAEGQKTPHRDLRVIVGKGIHSPGHVAKIKPAVQDLMQKWVGMCHKVLTAGTKSPRTLTRITLVC